MWRIANCVYRAFRQTATHCYSQDVLVPLTTVCNADDDNTKPKEKNVRTVVNQSDLNQVLKENRISYQSIEQLQEYLKKFSFQQFKYTLNVIKPVEFPPPPTIVVKEVPSTPPSPAKPEETLDSLLETDETCMKTIKALSGLHEDTMSIINLELALDALESGDFQFGIESLQASAKTGTNAAAFYNLGICYERGLGVEEDRAKACDYYRQAAALGHLNAQFNLTLLSNHIDINENDDEPTLADSPSTPRLRDVFLRFSLSMDYKEDQSFNDDQFDWHNQTVACLS